jgi:hypothetical protein
MIPLIVSVAASSAIAIDSDLLFYAVCFYLVFGCAMLLTHVQMSDKRRSVLQIVWATTSQLLGPQRFSTLKDLMPTAYCALLSATNMYLVMRVAKCAPPQAVLSVAEYGIVRSVLCSLAKCKGNIVLYGISITFQTILQFATNLQPTQWMGGAACIAANQSARGSTHGTQCRLCCCWFMGR